MKQLTRDDKGNPIVVELGEVNRKTYRDAVDMVEGQEEFIGLVSAYYAQVASTVVQRIRNSAPTTATGPRASVPPRNTVPSTVQAEPAPPAAAPPPDTTATNEVLQTIGSATGAVKGEFGAFAAMIKDRIANCVNSAAIRCG